MNPFPYSVDQHRYHTFLYDCRNRYGHRAVKIGLDAGFTCPNRDGTLGVSGCTFCSAGGSLEGIAGSSSLEEQYQAGLRRLQKWDGCLSIPYFQAYTSTYGSVAKIQSCTSLFLDRPEVCAIAYGTRPDCLEPDTVDYLESLTSRKDVWIELGLQTIHDKTALRIARGYPFRCFLDCMERLKKTHIRTCVHLINGLPGETEDDMLADITAMNALHPDAVKIHMLSVLENTVLGKEYRERPFPLLSRDEYVRITVEQIAHLDPDIIVERVTGDPPARLVLAPDWIRDKKKTLNAIDCRLAARNLSQGSLQNTADAGKGQF